MARESIEDAGRTLARQWVERKADTGVVSCWIGNSARRLVAFYDGLAVDGSHVRRAFMDSYRGHLESLGLCPDGKPRPGRHVPGVTDR